MINQWTVFWGILFWVGTPIIAAAKNRNVLGWLLFAVLTGPIAFLIIIFMPSVPREPEARCPWCKGGVPKDAVICMHCTRDMRESPEDEALPNPPAPSATVAAPEACKYCGDSGPEVKGLYGAYHRSCHVKALAV